MNIAIFVSGSGTNCENLIRHFEHSDAVKCALVVSNKPDAYALVRAERLGVPTAIAGKPKLGLSRAASSTSTLPCCPSSAAKACGATTSTRP